VFPVQGRTAALTLGSWEVPMVRALDFEEVQMLGGPANWGVPGHPFTRAFGDRCSRQRLAHVDGWDPPASLFR